MRWLTYLVLLPLIALATGFFGCISLVAGIWDKSGRQQHAIARAWANALLLISLSPVSLVYPERLRTREAAVYASNHLSYFDTPVLFKPAAFPVPHPGQAIAFGKSPSSAGISTGPARSPSMRKSGRSAIAGLLRGAKALEGGMPLVIFPEGGRTPDGRMSPFQSGAAFMAIKAQVPLVPLALIGTYELLPMHTYYLLPRPLKIVIGGPHPHHGPQHARRRSPDHSPLHHHFGHAHGELLSRTGAGEQRSVKSRLCFRASPFRCPPAPTTNTIG